MATQFSISVDVFCDCGARLEASYNENGQELTVSPCTDCLVDEYNRGFDEGKEA
jgi:hypothetical protein